MTRTYGLLKLADLTDDQRRAIGRGRSLDDLDILLTLLIDLPTEPNDRTILGSLDGEDIWVRQDSRIGDAWDEDDILPSQYINRASWIRLGDGTPVTWAIAAFRGANPDQVIGQAPAFVNGHNHTTV